MLRSENHDVMNMDYNMFAKVETTFLKQTIYDYVTAFENINEL